MVELLSTNTLIAIFLVIALGAWFGTVKFGPIRFGAAGALFLGLLVGAFVMPESAELTLLQNLGLGLFVYLIGLEAGEEFFKDIKAQFGLMAASVVAVTVGAGVAVFGGMALGLTREFSVGAFAGSLTSTPSLSLAQAQTGSADPAVGYSLGYPRASSSPSSWSFSPSTSSGKQRRTRWRRVSMTFVACSSACTTP